MHIYLKFIIYLGHAVDTTFKRKSKYNTYKWGLVSHKINVKDMYFNLTFIAG